MAHALTDIPDWIDVVVPDDGDNRNAASVQTPFSALANRTEFLRNGTDAPAWVADGDLQVNGGAQIGGDLAVGGASLSCNACTAYGLTSCQAGLTVVSGMTVSGTATFNNDVACTGHVTSNLSANFNSGFTSAGDCTHTSGTITYSGRARPLRKGAIGANANTSYDPELVNHVHVPVGGISATRNYTVLNTSGAGDHIRFSNRAADIVNVILPGGATAPISNTLPQDWVEAQRFGTNWYFVATGYGLV